MLTTYYLFHCPDLRFKVIAYSERDNYERVSTSKPYSASTFLHVTREESEWQNRAHVQRAMEAHTNDANNPRVYVLPIGTVGKLIEV